MKELDTTILDENQAESRLPSGILMKLRCVMDDDSAETEAEQRQTELSKAQSILQGDVAGKNSANEDDEKVITCHVLT